MNNPLTVTRAVPSDHAALTDLMRQSKAHWGYSPGQMKQWEKELTVTADYIAENEVHKATQGKNMVGFYAYYGLDDTTVKLDSLFILPEQMGQGIGRWLLHQFFDQVRQGGFTEVILYSDPNAEGFYWRLGFNVIGRQPTSIEGRYLPIMKKQL